MAFPYQRLDSIGLGGDATAFVVDRWRTGVQLFEEAADRLDVGGPVPGLVDGVPVAGAGAGAVGGQAEVDGDKAPPAVAGEAGQRDRGEGASERGVNAVSSTEPSVMDPGQSVLGIDDIGRSGRLAAGVSGVVVARQAWG